MPYVLIQHRVADYGKWKRVVNSAKPWRKASGEKSLQVYLSSRNPNDLTVVCQWDTAVRMQKFIKSPKLRERMMDAGVISKPSVTFYRKSEDLSV